MSASKGVVGFVKPPVPRRRIRTCENDQRPKCGAVGNNEWYRSPIDAIVARCQTCISQYASKASASSTFTMPYLSLTLNSIRAGAMRASMAVDIASATAPWRPTYTIGARLKANSLQPAPNRRPYCHLQSSCHYRRRLTTQTSLSTTTISSRSHKQAQ